MLSVFRKLIKAFIFFSFLISIPSNGGISWYSPSNFSQFISLSLLLKKKVNMAIFLFFIISIFILIIQSIYIQNFINLAKFLIVFGGITFAVNMKNENNLIFFKKIFFIYLFLDLLIRIILIDEAYLGSIYFLKHSSGIAVDSNFIGMFIAFAILGAIENQHKSIKTILILLFLLILTFSRTAYLLIFFYFLSMRYRAISIMLFIFFIFFISYLSQNLELAQKIDGSLYTKAIIADLYYQILEFDMSFIFGYGRYDIEFLSYKNSLNNMFYNGHSIYGFFSRDGFLFCLIFLIMNLYFFITHSKTKYVIPFCLAAVGVVSLWPVSYFGVTAMIYLIFKQSKN